MIRIMAIGALLLFDASVNSPGSIDFYEGNNGTQTKHCTFSDAPSQSYNLKKRGHPCPNDDLRSVVLNDVRAGAIIRVYDDPKGRPNKDDWTEIIVKKPHQQYIVHHFERTYEDEFVKVTYHSDNGLNGRVSHIKID